MLWLRLVEVCIFCLCVLSLLQVAAVYRDPSVGNLINIMIVKLIVVHNEQVSAGLAAWIQASSMSYVAAGPPPPALKGHCQPCQSAVSLENKRFYSEAASHLQTRGGGAAEEASCC